MCRWHPAGVKQKPGQQGLPGKMPGAPETGLTSFWFHTQNSCPAFSLSKNDLTKFILKTPLTVCFEYVSWTSPAADKIRTAHGKTPDPLARIQMLP
ncbi:hypothetical protein DTL42_05020 [Bremerella cremea]|uniref:Uncharacterized protein n=1 Tax=Bremerella cremea TaxID=1031537 RepID=A0A368KVN3_9BACT|nr:hypothetical protein DTL42_05020 [Bremerella cremea]